MVMSSCILIASQFRQHRLYGAERFSSFDHYSTESYVNQCGQNAIRRKMTFTSKVKVIENLYIIFWV